MHGTKSFSFLFISVLISIVVSLGLNLLLQFCRFPIPSGRWEGQVSASQGTVAASAEAEDSRSAVVTDAQGAYRLIQLRKHWPLPWYQKSETVAIGVSASPSSTTCYDYAEYLEVTFSTEHIQATALRAFQDRQRTQWYDVLLVLITAILIWGGICRWCRRPRPQA